MKRDMDLARSILQEIEKASYDGSWVDVHIPDHSDQEIVYHVMLLNEAGLIEAIDLSSADGPEWKPRRLTWEGHEFLEASRDENVWQEAKRIMAEKGGGFVFELGKQLLIELAKGRIFT